MGLGNARELGPKMMPKSPYAARTAARKWVKMGQKWVKKWVNMSKWVKMMPKPPYAARTAARIVDRGAAGCAPGVELGPVGVGADARAVA